MKVSCQTNNRLILTYHIIQLSSEVCRLELQHVEPSSKFSALEREEFLNAAQVITSRHRQVSIDSLHGKTKRSYKLWNSSEKYSLLLAVSLYGMKDFGVLMNIMENRSENQVTEVESV